MLSATTNFLNGDLDEVVFPPPESVLVTFSTTTKLLNGDLVERMKWSGIYEGASHQSCAWSPFQFVAESKPIIGKWNTLFITFCTLICVLLLRQRWTVSCSEWCSGRRLGSKAAGGGTRRAPPDDGVFQRRSPPAPIATLALVQRWHCCTCTWVTPQVSRRPPTLPPSASTASRSVRVPLPQPLCLIACTTTTSPFRSHLWTTFREMMTDTCEHSTFHRQRRSGARVINESTWFDCVIVLSHHHRRTANFLKRTALWW